MATIVINKDKNGNIQMEGPSSVLEKIDELVEEGTSLSMILTLLQNETSWEIKIEGKKKKMKEILDNVNINDNVIESEDDEEAAYRVYPI